MVKSPVGKLGLSGTASASLPMSGEITEFPVPTPNAGPDGIALGPDGAVVHDGLRVMFDWIHPMTTSQTVFGATTSNLIGMRFDFNW